MKFDNPIDQLLAGEAAASLGMSGRKLKQTLDALRQFEADVAARARSADPVVRNNLVMDAAEAYWGYVVQREQFGLLDSDTIAKDYAVPDEVKRVMGPKLGS
ncbi:hypothetical protein ACFPN2_00115 [Steroidobacter flavus]|uniref:Uncharacterized protein n=1 Tax=Steroidobacter flavus TaxID=1842136 RepID=A0ABV8SIQ8_9GAMM